MSICLRHDNQQEHIHEYKLIRWFDHIEIRRISNFFDIDISLFTFLYQRQIRLNIKINLIDMFNLSIISI